MNDTPITILRLGLTLNANGLVWYKHEWFGKETANSYLLKMSEDLPFDKIPAKRVPKDKLMVPNNVTYDTHKYVSYRVWCLPEMEAEAEAVLYERVISTAKAIRDEAMQMFYHLEGK